MVHHSHVKHQLKDFDCETKAALTAKLCSLWLGDLFVKLKQMTCNPGHDLVFLNCDWKAIISQWFTPSTSQALHCSLAILSLYASPYKLSIPLHLLSMHYFHALALHFTAPIENWVITSWRQCSKVTSLLLPLFLSVLSAPFPPLPFERPLFQHAQCCIPQTVGAPSNVAQA